MSHCKNEGIQIIIKKMHINKSYILQYIQLFIKVSVILNINLCKSSLDSLITLELTRKCKGELSMLDEGIYLKCEEK